MDHNKLQCIRYSLVAFNLMFLAFGIMICIFTNFGLASSDRLLNILFNVTPAIRTIRICFITTGFILMFNSILGLAAIVHKRFSFLVTFCFILIGSFIFTLFSISMGIVSDHSLRKHNNTNISNSYLELMEQFDWNHSSNKSSQIINDFQRDFQCCGSFNASKSWELLRPKNVPLGAYPLSCCHYKSHENSRSLWCDEQQVKNKVSCLSAINDEINELSKSLETILDILCEVGIVELLCIICIYLLRSEPIERNISYTLA